MTQPTTMRMTHELLRHLDFAMSPAPEEESAINEFALLLLRALGYTGSLRSRVLLLVQEDKRHLT